MGECENCGGYVSHDYIRVFAPEGRENSVRMCVNCDDLVRDGNDVRTARAVRN